MKFSPRDRFDGRRFTRQALWTAAVGLVWFCLLAPTGLGGPVGLIWVSGSSMEPGMHTGDLAVTYERSSYDVGDMVAFEIPEGGTVIHRIIEVTDAGYRFQGDNRAFPDPWVLDETSITGSRVLFVPRAAAAMTFLGKPSSLAVLVMLLFVLRLGPDPTTARSVRPRRMCRPGTDRTVLGDIESAREG